MVLSTCERRAAAGVVVLSAVASGEQTHGRVHVQQTMSMEARAGPLDPATACLTLIADKQTPKKTEQV